MVGTQDPASRSDRRQIDAPAPLEAAQGRPGRQAGDEVVPREREGRPGLGAVDPDRQRPLGRAGRGRGSHAQRALRRTLSALDLPEGSKQLAARAQVQEPGLRQGNHGGGELGPAQAAQGRRRRALRAQGEPDLRVEVEEPRLAIGGGEPLAAFVPAAAAEQQAQGRHAQQPHARVDVEVVARRLPPDLDRCGLLPEEGDGPDRALRRPPVPGHEIDAEMPGHRRRHAHPDAGDVRPAGRNLQRIEIQPDVAGGHQHRGPRTGLRQRLQVRGDLEIHQHLVEPPRSQALDGGHRQEDLAQAGIGGEPPALPARVQDEALAVRQPGKEIGPPAPAGPLPPRLVQQVHGATARAQSPTPGISADKNLPASKFRQPLAPQAMSRRRVQEVPQRGWHGQQDLAHFPGKLAGATGLARLLRRRQM